MTRLWRSNTEGMLHVILLPEPVEHHIGFQFWNHVLAYYLFCPVHRRVVPILCFSFRRRGTKARQNFTVDGWRVCHKRTRLEVTINKYADPFGGTGIKEQALTARARAYRGDFHAAAVKQFTQAPDEHHVAPRYLIEL